MAETGTDFLQPDENRDFPLLVEGAKVYVNRDLLANWSPVWRKIFYPQGALFSQPEGAMEMKEKKLDEFIIFLKAVLPTEKALLVNESNVAVLLAYADEYDVAVLRQQCVKYMGDQLKEGNVVGKALIEYLRLSTTYNLKDLQKRIIPLVAQLSVDQIAAAHEMLPVAVLAAVYQAKAKGLAQQVAINSQMTLPGNAFYCADCRGTIRSITKGASTCCQKGVDVLAKAVAQIEAKWSFTCSKCSKPCMLNCGTYRVYQQSLCCGCGVFVQPKVDSAAAADFSAELLDRQQ